MTIFRPHITQMKAYSPPLEGRDPHQHLLLDFNERTLPVSDRIKQALIRYIQDDRLQMYPSYGQLTNKIANYCGVNESQVMLTNGSDQGIDLIIRAACTEGDEAIIPTPTFAMYHQCAKVENLSIIEPVYSRASGFPKQGVMEAISDRTRLIVLANPNNPCGTLIPRADILAIAKAAPQAAILVDECYFEYSQETLADAVNDYPNILITRTFSKTWGLPSIRLGYVISHSDNIKALLNVRGPYDINQFAAVAIDAALDYPEESLSYVREVMDQAKPLLEAWLDRKNIVYWPSAANFVWLFPENPKQAEQHLRELGILVRPKMDAKGQTGLRVTIGNLPQTKRLIETLDQVL